MNHFEMTMIFKNQFGELKEIKIKKAIYKYNFLLVTRIL